MTEPQPNRGFSWTQAPWGSALVCEALLPFAPHLFTAGNLTLRDDAREWEAVAAAMGVPRTRIRLIRQVHGSAIAIATRRAEGPWAPTEADVIISDDPSVAIAVRVADCSPILIADSRLGAVAAVHAGWRGTVQRAAAAGVRALETELGSRPVDMIAAIGPCLGPCCGEVGVEVVEAFRGAGHELTAIQRWFSPGPSGRPLMNLWSANRDQLMDAGVAAANIYVAELCTRTSPEVFHSYRAHGVNAGRMLGIIKVKGPQRPFTP
jgi:purine-nucleoside/S-methyl-5'-thioadenosine phosphorylase / adenosine deaminase